MDKHRHAAIVTIGTELVTGVRVDTNTREISAVLRGAGYSVVEAITVPDDFEHISRVLHQTCNSYQLVVATGGLGPTHDDVTREAAADALDLELIVSPDLEAGLHAVIALHADIAAASQIRKQALVLSGAEVIPAVRGTAPGQLVKTPAGVLLLLPGPPNEMRPMLESFVGTARTTAEPRVLSCTGITEPDAQIAAMRVLRGREGIGLGVLASPGDVSLLLFDEGAGASELNAAATAVRNTLGQVCYAEDGSTLPQVVVNAAVNAGLTVATAESCTGGRIASALTDVPGSSAAYTGTVVAYSDSIKSDLLDVPVALLEEHSAVSEPVAIHMAEGLRRRLGADVCISVTGIAGPTGAMPGKPVGLVWFAVATAAGVNTHSHVFAGNREMVRTRATMRALDLVRTTLLGN